MITTNCGARVKTPASCSQWSPFLSRGCWWGAAAVFWGCAFIALPEQPVQGAPGWFCPCRLGDSCLPHPALPSDPQRDNIVFEAWASPCSRSLQKLWPIHGGPKEGGAAVWCPCTPAGDSHPVALHSLSSRAHSFCVFLTLPVVLPLMQVHFLLVLPVEAWPLKKVSWIWNVSREFKRDPEVWVNDLKNHCLQIWCFTGSAKFDSCCWWHSQL